VSAAEQRIARLLLLGTSLVLVAVLAAWFLESFERHTEQVAAGMSAEAQRNPFLAAERFLRQVGIAAESVGDRGRLRELPPTGDTLVVDGLGALNEERRTALRSWVEAGGHLFITPMGPPGDEPSANRDFAAAYGVRLQELEGLEPGATVVAKVSFAQYPEALELELPAGRVLMDTSGRADGGVSAGGFLRLLQFDAGDGRLTVTSDMAPYTNARIGQRDHALFLALLTERNERGKVWLLYSTDMPWLGALFWRHAPFALVSACCLVLAIIWRLGGRLGPLLPPREPRRRDLIAHLEALSEFHWRHGRGSHLVQVTRQRVERDLLRRQPLLRGLTPAERSAWVAERSGLAVEQVRAALYPSGADDRRLVAETRLLRRLWVLAGGGRWPNLGTSESRNDAHGDGRGKNLEKPGELRGFGRELPFSNDRREN
jgi:hypothetical protein